MSLTERERHDAYEALHAAFGDHTDNVIRMFTPDHDTLVTKDDLAVATGVLRSEMADLRAELKTEMADVRTEMADLRTELKTEMADLRTDLKTEMAGLRTELKAEMGELRVQFSHDITTAFAAQTRTMTIGLVASVILIALTNTLTVLVG